MNNHHVTLSSIIKILFMSRIEHNRIQMWLNDDSSPEKTIRGNRTSPYALFIRLNGDVYVEDGQKLRFAKRTANSTSSVAGINVTDYPHGIFIDIDLSQELNEMNEHNRETMIAIK
ncbi:unnamed protein product [Adineta ricciae]|uniref:Uncharacterized protein n=1 Tax=Adineta ricciae TaxID=249248 RepID=A0A813WKM8_ADIRI|nr:unnamed protein product [Adineta ricciae]CAF1216178.1 unnamed protein product [Adineta ricciae]